MKNTIIDLIRHGEPQGGARYRGHRIDDPLSEKGWAQMWAAIGSASPWQQIITSPLQRCQAFADALAKKLGLPVQVDERFREVGFGDWEGLTKQQVQARSQSEYNDFYRDPVNSRPQGAEALDRFMLRTSQALDEAIRNYQGRHILIVAHAGVIRSLVSYTLGGSADAMYRINVANAGMTRIVHSGQRTLLQYHNQSSCPESG